MALLEQDHAFEIADAILAASSADETEVALHCTEDRFVRFAHEGPTQCADRERYELAVRVRYRDGEGFREARASTGTLDDGSLVGALRRAELLAGVAAPDVHAVPLEGAVDVEGTAPSRPTQDHSFKEKAEWVDAALRRCEAESLRGAGIARTTVASRSLVNSAGRRVHGATSRSEFSLTCDHPDAGGGAPLGGQAAASSIRSYVDRVDVEGTIESAVTRAVEGRDPAEIEARPFDVVLMPEAVAALVSQAALAGFGAREFHEGASFLAGRCGERLFDADLIIADDPAHPAFGGLRFDGEGTPRGRTELVREGTALGPVTDAAWARRLGLDNTGHARPQPSSAGPRAEHLVVEEGIASLDELLETLGDGLLVHHLHYVNLVEPRDLVLTGMTRGGLFRVRGGRADEPVEDLRFTQSLVEALGSAVVGDRAERAASLLGGEVVAPPLLVRGFRFTSRAQG
ncbi:MAG: TldD/PmbA family protein [Planctomycetota bacterium]